MLGSGSVQKTPGNGGFFRSGVREIGGALFILAAVAALYLVVTGFGYVWDDRIFFLTSTDLRQGNVVRAITDPVLSGSAYFRPLVMAWFVAELRLLGADPFYPHLSNLLLHIGNTALVGVLAWRLCRANSQLGPTALACRVAAAMLLYGLHPALTEPVSWISGRFDLTVAFFSLLTLLLITSPRRGLAMFAALAFFAAALSKEMAVTVPLIAVLVIWGLRYPDYRIAQLPQMLRARENLYPLAAVLLAGVIYLGFRAHYLHAFAMVDPALQSLLDSLPKRIAFVGWTLSFYVKTMLWPFKDIGPLHPFDISAMQTLDIVKGSLWVLASMCFAVWTLFRPSLTKLLLLSSGIALLPVANIIPLNILGNIGHERFLVLPLALAVLGVITLQFEKWPVSDAMRERLPVILLSALALWSAAAALNIRVTAPLWRDDLTLWRWAYSQHPESLFAQFSLASAALRDGQYDIAKDVIMEVEKRGQMPLRLSVPYGHYLIRTGQVDLGIQKIQAALANELQPHLEVLKAGIALDKADIRKSDYGGWLEVYAYTAMAEGHLSQRKFDAALQDSQVALFYQRTNPMGLVFQSLSNYGLGNWELGQQQFAAARESFPANDRAGVTGYRAQFLSQLCSAANAANTTADVCGRFAREPALPATSAAPSTRVAP